MLVAMKEDGGGKVQYRMVVNYRALNAITISPEYPLPTLHAVLNMLHSAKVLTVLDMEQGFHQTRVDQHDHIKLRFVHAWDSMNSKYCPSGRGEHLRHSRRS